MTGAVPYEDPQLESAIEETAQRKEKTDCFVDSQKTNSGEQHSQTSGDTTSFPHMSNRISSTFTKQNHNNSDKESQEMTEEITEDMTKEDHTVVDIVRVDVDSKGPTKSNTCENCGQELVKDNKSSDTSTWKSESSLFSLYQQSNVDICRICHCEGELCKNELIAPCKCKGSLEFVHHSCLQRWIKSSGNKHCELCKFHFEMNSKLKPFKKWEKLDISKAERRRISCSVGFHLIAIVCVVWSMYVLVEKTATEVEKGELEWPFWTKLVVVAVGLTGAVIFMYMQCKTYINLWKRLKAYNRIICVQHQPENAIEERITETNVMPGSSTTQPNTSREETTVVIANGCSQKDNVV